MFNLLVMYGGWPAHQSTFTSSRILEATEDHIAAEHRLPGGAVDFQKLQRYPCLFMPEQGSGDDLARIGHITRVAPSGRTEVMIEYSYDPYVAPVPVDWVRTVAGELQMGSFAFSRTHWAVKDVDIYRVFVRAMAAQRNAPSVFNIGEAINVRQMSAMMPFEASFTPVYQAIQRAGGALGMTVNRADDIWVHHQIIQDIVSLIDRSRIIVVDCTNKNPNVFYEAGIAHTLGREVILITQHIDFVPFDLRHLRAITYLNNGEGLQHLETALTDRARTLLGN